MLIMSEKAFNKNLTPRCEYCAHGRTLPGITEIICKKKGITYSDDSCRRYKYDPLKRNPKKTEISDNYSPEDFLI